MACGLPKITDEDGKVITWREGDLQPRIEFTLADGALVSASTIALRVRRPDGTILSIGATDLGGSDGEFVFAADSLQAGPNQRAELHRSAPAADVFTWPPFLIDVDPKVGT